MNDTKKTRILSILEPLRSADPVFESLFLFVSSVPDIPEDMMKAIDELLVGLLEGLRQRVDAESIRRVEDARANIRTLMDADRQADEAEADDIARQVYYS
jgi:hypothetical protein